MIKKLSDKDKKDWESFVESKEKIYNKDLTEKTLLDKKILTKTIDLHGVRHKDVYGLIEKPCVEDDIPFVVVTGQSVTMKKIVTEIVATFGSAFNCLMFVVNALAS